MANYLFSLPGFSDSITLASSFPDTQFQEHFRNVSKKRKRATRLKQLGIENTVHDKSYIGYTHVAVLWLISVIEKKNEIPDAKSGRLGKAYPILAALRTAYDS